LIGAASHSFLMGNSKIESENCWLIGLLIGLVTDSTSSAISLFLSDIAEEVRFQNFDEEKIVSKNIFSQNIVYFKP